VKLDPIKVHEARERMGFSLDDVAQAAGVSQTSAIRAEHGKEIRPLTARRIARGLGVEVADLYPKAEAPTPSTSSPKSEAEERRAIDLPQEDFRRALSEARSDAELIDLYYRLEAERTNAELILRDDEANRNARADYARAVERRIRVFLKLLDRGVTLPDREAEQLTRQVEQLEELQLN
jgi:transcriptional regulator with XRE-family HTH domain